MIAEDLLDEFDRRWQEVRPDGSNEPPRIDDYLPRDVSGTQQKDHLERLIAIDLEYRWRQIAGELGGTEAVAETTFIAPGLEDYAGRFAAILEGVGFSEELWDEAAEIRSRFLKNDAGELPELPGYRILAVLGQGGKGVVYKAEQISLNRIVALKTIREPWSGSPVEIARLRNEALTLASLNHPNLVTAYAFEHAQGIWYLVMEYVDGTDLGSHLNNRVLPGQQAAGYLLKAAQGVQCAHEAHILHRDLKPSNILLDRRGIIRVTDFGLSRLMSPPPGGSRLTASNAVLGTPGYIAPEQAAGSQALLSAATDVYGLGATLYHMLTGRPPFVGETVLDVLRQVEQSEPVPPRQLQPGVPVALQTICLKCLEKKPDRRYATAGLLADDLHRFLQGLPIRARPVGRAERMHRWCQRNPLLASLGATSLIMLMALVYLLVAGSVQKSAALELSLQQQRQTESALARERQWNRRARDSFARQAFLEYRENRLHNVRSLLKAIAESDSDAERSWEWHYLTSLVEDDPRDTFQVGTERAPWVTAIAVSPNGRWLAAGSGLPAYMDAQPDAPADLKVWDLQTGRLHLDVHGEVLSVAHLLFSPDSRDLYAVERNDGFATSREVFSGPSRVRRWNLETVDELPPLLDQSRVATLHWSADHQHLAATEVDEIGPGRLLQIVIPDASDVMPQITPYEKWQRRQDGPGFVVDSAQPAPIVIQTDGVCHVPPPVRLHDPVEWCGIKWRLVLSPAREDLMCCYDCGSQQLIHVVQCPPIEQVALSPSEQLVAIATNQGEIQIRDTDSWRIRLTLRGHDARVRSLAFDPTETRLYSGDWDGRLRRWDLRNSREFREVLVSRPGSDTAAFTVRHDGQLVALTAGHPLQWQNPDGDTPRATVTIPFSTAATAPGRKAAFAGSGTRLYVMNQEETNQIDVWDVDAGRVVRQFTEHTLPIGHLSVQGDRLISTAWVPATKTERWDKPAELLLRHADGTIVFRTQEIGVRYYRAVLNSDGTRLAATVERYDPEGISGDLVRTWDVTTGTIIDEMPTRTWALGLQFFEHSNHLAAAEFDSGDLLIRDPEQHQTVLRLEGVVPQSQDFCLLDHDHRLAAVSRFDFRLINLETGNEVLSQNLVTFSSDYIFNPQLIRSSDSRQLLMNQADGTIRILGDHRRGDSEPSGSPPLEESASD